MTSPRKMSHLVMNTNRIPEMRDWYCTVLGAEVVQENARLCFISYDEEHHRIAFANPGPLAPKPAWQDGRPSQVGFNHVAFNFATLDELLDQYARLKGLGIVPHWCVNHGPTTSLYYRDPDGNRVELEVDNFAALKDCKDFMKGEIFARDPRGPEIDPEQMIARRHAGVTAAELAVRG